MPDLLKDMLNHKSLTEFAMAIKSVYATFPVSEFVTSTMDETWNSLELKARGRQVSINLGKYLPADYRTAIGIIDKVITSYNGPSIFCFPDFVEVFGQDDADWDFSIAALKRYTPYASSEFAVRPFIIKDEKRMMAQMYAWSKHENEHVRRLSSEGCRPQLPWGLVLSTFKKDPSPILPILEQLKTDPSSIVRNSVANNLNDISKTNPDIVVKLAQDWYGKDESTDWILKHGCRTLLKKGDRTVLAIFGFEDATSINVDDLVIESPSISYGEDLVFAFTIMSSTAIKVRLEYAIDYVKSSGKRNRKVFKISEVVLKAKEKRSYTRRHAFQDNSTRKHYPGIHSITLIVNGTERGMLDFELVV
ncbi:MAG: DNA alkylation repair protein [Coriobacteriales bacterium]|nr:DNA alkylation repair protein [Coriobacteriales bacterium]